MATLTVASKADTFLTLPAILAISFLSQVESSFKFTVKYEDKHSLAEAGQYAEYTAAGANTLKNDRIIEYVFQKLSSLLRGNQENVSCSYLNI